MKKYLFYAMEGEKMCFMHVLMNALDLEEAGHEVKIVFEGASVKLAAAFEKEENPLYKKAKDKGFIAGVCEACSKTLGVYDDVKDTDLTLLNDMNGHAGMRPFIEEGFEVFVF